MNLWAPAGLETAIARMAGGRRRPERRWSRSAEDCREAAAVSCSVTYAAMRRASGARTRVLTCDGWRR